MPEDDGRWAAAFPVLFTKNHVEYADCQLGFTTQPVPDELVARLHLVAMTPQRQVIVCRSNLGWRFLPGGTREDGESLVELARRELMEEAGARMTGSVEIFASHVADSLRDAPYRPHLPHPRAYWGYAVTEAELVQPPTNPMGRTSCRLWPFRRQRRQTTSQTMIHYMRMLSASPTRCA